MKQDIAKLADLTEKKCIEFEFACDSEIRNGFAFVLQNKLYVYENKCPHTQVTLNWLPKQFFDSEEKFIQCSLHGALFEPDSGLCVHGPCLEKFLISVDYQIDENGTIYI